MYQNSVRFEEVKSLAHGSFAGTYTAIGDPLTRPALSLYFYNQTDGDVFVSTDGSDDMFIVPASTYAPVQAFANGGHLFPRLTQFYVKDGPSTPTSGTFYIMALIVDA